MNPKAPTTNHFVATCAQYRSFTFNVPKLRELYDKRRVKSKSALVRFQAGFLDTLAQGYDEEEARCIREALDKCLMTGVTVVFGEEETTVKVTQSRPSTPQPNVVQL